MSIVYTGDIHNDDEALSRVLSFVKKQSAKAIVITGDVGLGFFEDPPMVMHLLCERDTDIDIFFCDGNHDNHEMLDRRWRDSGMKDIVEIAPRAFHVRRGALVEIDNIKHIFMGGARSIDKDRRIEGKTWWAREVPSREEMERFVVNMDSLKPEVVVSHDCPLGDMRPWRFGGDEDPVARDLANAWNIISHSPDLWIFGHHHVMMQSMQGKTMFACAGLEGQGFVRNSGVVTSFDLSRGT